MHQRLVSIHKKMTTNLQSLISKSYNHKISAECYILSFCALSQSRAKCENNVYATGKVIPYFFGYKMEFFPFQNNPKNLDPSYKMNLDLWDCLGMVKLIAKFHKTDLVIRSHSKEENPRLIAEYIWYVSPLLVAGKT